MVINTLNKINCIYSFELSDHVSFFAYEITGEHTVNFVRNLDFIEITVKHTCNIK
jgi:hypothetical protein